MGNYLEKCTAVPRSSYVACVQHIRNDKKAENDKRSLTGIQQMITCTRNIIYLGMKSHPCISATKQVKQINATFILKGTDDSYLVISLQQYYSQSFLMKGMRQIPPPVTYKTLIKLKPWVCEDTAIWDLRSICSDIVGCTAAKYSN